MYSCLNLRLPRAKKTWWKKLTSKIQTKLHNRKTITKTKRSSRRIKPASITSSSSSSSFSQAHNKLFFLKRLRIRGRRSIISNAAAVYVDKLFKEPPLAVAEQVAAEKKSPTCSEAAKLVKVVENDDNINKVRNIDEKGCDDAWEAMVFASPLMRGIDQRAENFIARFRADMELQETLARGL